MDPRDPLRERGHVSLALGLVASIASIATGLLGHAQVDQAKQESLDESHNDIKLRAQR